jgi:quercetin dioxygenase-like cupin family protein
VTHATAPSRPSVPRSATTADDNSDRPRFLRYDRRLSAFEDTSKLQSQKIWEGVAGRAIHGERITLGVIELEPNSVVPEHSHENEQLGIVISGSVEFRVGDETRRLGPGETWSIPSQTPHEVVTGPDGAVMIDVFSPVREDWKPLERIDRAPLWP